VTDAALAGKPERTVVLGLGNILLGDEGVGVRVVEELERRGGRGEPAAELQEIPPRIAL
jgi:Ni,Fe-hydrogenase maturation factor